MRRIALLTCAIVTVAFLPALSARGATSQSAETVRELVNDARGSAELAALPIDPRVADIAKKHAARMRDQGRIYHNPNVSTELDAMGVDWSRWGENVGVGPSVQDVHAGFMNSSTHKANILDSGFTAIGTGVALSNNGRVYVAQVFAIIRADEEETAPVGSGEPEVLEERAVAVSFEEPPVASSESSDHLRTEEESLSSSSFYSAEHCASAYTVAEDQVIVPLSYFEELPYC